MSNGYSTLGAPSPFFYNWPFPNLQRPKSPPTTNAPQNGWAIMIKPSMYLYPKTSMNPLFNNILDIQILSKVHVRNES